MARFLAILALVGCGKAEQKPVDTMDEKMRHCPVAIDGATATLTDIEGGVQFDVQAPADKVAEVQRRAHHVVEFAAKRHDKTTHGVSDKQGGGTMRNCPVVTSDTAITVEDLANGARLRITGADAAVLRAESRRRIEKFTFVGATIVVK
jgi:hypothetical protein